jgi:hypothetical protein
MSSMQKRAEKTLEYIRNEEVSFTEAVVHVYLWTRFEWSIIQRNKHAKRAQELSERLNRRLDDVSFRISVKETIEQLPVSPQSTA